MVNICRSACSAAAHDGGGAAEAEDDERERRVEAGGGAQQQDGPAGEPAGSRGISGSQKGSVISGVTAGLQWPAGLPGLLLLIGIK